MIKVFVGKQNERYFAKMAGYELIAQSKHEIDLEREFMATFLLTKKAYESEGLDFYTNHPQTQSELSGTIETHYE